MGSACCQRSARRRTQGRQRHAMQRYCVAESGVPKRMTDHPWSNVDLIPLSIYTGALVFSISMHCLGLHDQRLITVSQWNRNRNRRINGTSWELCRVYISLSVRKRRLVLLSLSGGLLAVANLCHRPEYPQYFDVPKVWPHPGAGWSSWHPRCVSILSRRRR